MSRMLFVNTHVSDIKSARTFFGALGFTFNENFCDDATLCMAVNELTWVMLMTAERFRGFIADDMCDTEKEREVLLCISAETRADVDRIVDTALAHGGRPWMQPQDHGFMYGRAFRDPDNHVWEVMWMDPVVAAGERPAETVVST
ncbi:glyoxalase [Hoyosella sp. YIM 151337]|uniref:VOC family protein n=1 Tax=Hoyosella sp. YIM 151337 TaxID=2992742 RepID=UPI002235B4E4|nr:VOC family protein [Hoyosella sp. YIM 151337]MCW4353087.1 glyoxalase [Hoyosella sp. YIM 151337]